MILSTLRDGVFAPYRIPSHDIRLLLTGSPPRLATSMPTGLPGAPGGKKSGNSTRRLLRSMTVRLWPEVRALPLGAERRVALSGAVRNPLCYAQSQTQALRQACNGLHPFGCINFVDHGR